jgi:L-rhamnose isomerase
MPNPQQTERAYELAKERFAEVGVDVDAAVKRLATIPISLHCWQGDDVGGFENPGGALGGGLAVTGNYPGKARSADELRADLDVALSLLPGKHRLNLHAIYGEFGGRKVDRDGVAPEQFANWLSWAKGNGIGLDFNPSYFSHPKAADGLTLSNADAGVRQFWVDHGIACRKIGAGFGRALGSPCVTNVWVPDGMKDTPADRKGPRERLRDSLDQVFAEPIDPAFNLDAIEGKLFGLGVESYTVGSHEFYLAYALQHGKLLCMDAGHYHPTESLADKLSSVLCFLPEVLLHVSRGVRWDSDHVVTLGDDLLSIGREVVANGYEKRVHIGLDFFDASINRVAAWVIGTRNMLKALLAGLLEPTAMLRKMEADRDYTGRLAMQEEARSLPLGAVWDHYCLSHGVPVAEAWLATLKGYERDVLSQRA